MVLDNYCPPHHHRLYLSCHSHGLYYYFLLWPPTSQKTPLFPVCISYRIIMQWNPFNTKYITQNPANTKWNMCGTIWQAWKKMFISLQAGQNFHPAGQISLQCEMVSVMYFFIFSLQIKRFSGKEASCFACFFQACHMAPQILYWWFLCIMWLQVNGTKKKKQTNKLNFYNFSKSYVFYHWTKDIPEICTWHFCVERVNPNQPQKNLTK